MADTKIIFSCNFVALLTDFLKLCIADAWQGAEYVYESKYLYISKCFGNLSESHTI